MIYILNNQQFDTGTDTAQAILQEVHKMGLRLQCPCIRPMPQMYIAHQAGTYFIKRMPSSGIDHSPDCGSFAPPEELSGLAQVHGTAIEENPDDGTTLLRLDFPLSIRGKRSAAPPPSMGVATEAKSVDRKLTLTSLLHFLWHEADLVKWVPAMESKRWWGVVQGAVLGAAANKIAKQQSIATKLYIPAPFHKDRIEANAARRNQFFRTLTESASNATALGIVIAEFKAIEPTRLGGRFVFKHMPDCHFFADADLVAKFNRVFEAQLMLADMQPDTHIIVIATFSMAKAGYPVLQDIGMMLTTSNWIPFEHTRDAALIDAMTKAKRRFTKSLRFNLPLDAPIASMITTDTAPPVAMFVTHPTDDGSMETLLSQTATEGTYRSWMWLGDAAMPELPALGHAVPKNPDVAVE